MRWSHHRAATTLKNGGVIAYPTEAVYGLGCHPLHESAVNRLLQLKQRDPGKGLILITDDFKRLEPFLNPLSASERSTISRNLLKPTTWIIPVQDWVPSWLTGWHGSLAVRVTQHPIAAALCQLADMPIVSTSANIAGHRAAQTSIQVRLKFGQQLDAIVAGNVDRTAKPSRIINIKTGRVIR